MGRPKKVYQPPIDVVGKNVRWSPDGKHEYMFGKVVKVWLRLEKCGPYPHSRKLARHIAVETADNRVFKMRAESEDLKRIKMIADVEN